MSRRVELSVDEIVAMLKRSSIPTILVEGPDDIIVFRWLKRFIALPILNPQNCYGRTNLLKLYERKNEFTNIKTFFLADQDMYLFVGIPPQYSEIIWTSGYSIENDIYAGNTKIDDLLEEEERENFNEIMNDIIKWFAFEVQEHRNGRNYKVDIKSYQQHSAGNDETHIKIDYNNDKTCFKGQLIHRGDYIKPPDTQINDIKNDFKLRIRGKIIFDLFMLYFNAPKRSVKHKKLALFEIGSKPVDQHPYLKKIIQAINAKIYPDTQSD